MSNDMKQAIIEEASLQMTGHPSKDARWFAKSVYEYFMAEPPAEQEPVAWGMPNIYGEIYDVISPDEHARMPGQYTVPLYTTPKPRKREPLTDEEIQDLLKVGNPTEDEYRLIRMGWNAAHRVGGKT